ncbi:MAG: hypothetical protein CR997_11905 [Acidobacteria bacterium]|nr:MAG: hypothetical protein CR997_11905 [Acidobacteriota bacterium]
MKHTLLSTILFLFPLVLVGQQTDLNQRGIDPKVDYNKLFQKTTTLGIPWDDRNLNITKDDLDILPAGEYDDVSKIPVFYRILFRKEYPNMKTKGKGQYPLSAPEVFEVLYGGLMRDGYVEGENPIQVNSEVEITSGRKSAESAIAINPVDPNLVIAGVNGPTGQEMYFSQDAGLTWTRSTSNLGNSCCDPTVGWSPDGQIAYMAQLGTCFLVCNIEFFTSTDYGQTWGNKVTVADGMNNDKEFIHVDLHPTSPYYGNVYIHYHSFNEIKFAHSTDNGQTFSTPISFSGTRGIGGDITTDTQGKIYHVWQSMETKTVRLNLSTDGGQSFSPMTAISNLNAEFNYFIPCFDNRGVPVIVNTAADISGGPFTDYVYVCWNDLQGPESTPEENHSSITVARSSDGGNTWELATPHTMDDIQTVDRFNPWLDVDSQGRVHLVYYSTQNDPARLKPDLYHTISLNGGVDWETPVRVTAVSSNYIADNFQWGDYNGMSIVGDQVRPIWTDNRASVSSFTADMRTDNLPSDFSMRADTSSFTLCMGASIEPFTLELQGINGFSDSVNLSFAALPAGFSGQFQPATIAVPGQSTVSLSTDTNAQEGLHAITIQAQSGELIHDVSVEVYVRTQDVTTTSGLWRQQNSYYDFNQSGVVDLLDLIMLFSCYP